MDVHHQIIIILLFRVKFDGEPLTNDKVKALSYITTIPIVYIPPYATLMPFHLLRLHIFENPTTSARVDRSNSEYSGCTILGNETATECRVTPTCQAGKVLRMVKHYKPSSLLVGPLLVPLNLFPKFILPAYFLIYCRQVLGSGI